MRKSAKATLPVEMLLPVVLTQQGGLHQNPPTCKHTPGAPSSFARMQTQGGAPIATNLASIQRSPLLMPQCPITTGTQIHATQIHATVWHGACGATLQHLPQPGAQEGAYTCSSVGQRQVTVHAAPLDALCTPCAPFLHQS